MGNSSGYSIQLYPRELPTTTSRATSAADTSVVVSLECIDECQSHAFHHRVFGISENSSAGAPFAPIFTSEGANGTSALLFHRRTVAAAVAAGDGVITDSTGGWESNPQSGKREPALLDSLSGAALGEGGRVRFGGSSEGAAEQAGWGVSAGVEWWVRQRSSSAAAEAFFEAREEWADRAVQCTINATACAAASEDLPRSSSELRPETPVVEFPPGEHTRPSTVTAVELGIFVVVPAFAAAATREALRVKFGGGLDGSWGEPSRRVPVQVRNISSPAGIWADQSLGVMELLHAALLRQQPNRTAVPEPLQYVGVGVDDWDWPGSKEPPALSSSSAPTPASFVLNLPPARTRLISRVVVPGRPAAALEGELEYGWWSADSADDGGGSNTVTGSSSNSSKAQLQRLIAQSPPEDLLPLAVSTVTENMQGVAAESASVTLSWTTNTSHGAFATAAAARAAAAATAIDTAGSVGVGETAAGVAAAARARLLLPQVYIVEVYRYCMERFQDDFGEWLPRCVCADMCVGASSLFGRQPEELDWYMHVTTRAYEVGSDAMTTAVGPAETVDNIVTTSIPGFLVEEGVNYSFAVYVRNGVGTSLPTVLHGVVFTYKAPPIGPLASLVVLGVLLGIALGVKLRQLWIFRNKMKDFKTASVFKIENIVFQDREHSGAWSLQTKQHTIGLLKILQVQLDREYQCRWIMQEVLQTDKGGVRVIAQDHQLGHLVELKIVRSVATASFDSISRARLVAEGANAVRVDSQHRPEEKETAISKLRVRLNLAPVLKHEADLELQLRHPDSPDFMVLQRCYQAVLLSSGAWCAFVMEPMDSGVSVRSILAEKDQPLKERQALVYAQRVLEGLGKLHRENLLHRNINRCPPSPIACSCPCRCPPFTHSLPLPARAVPPSFEIGTAQTRKVRLLLQPSSEHNR
jgi:hypothetical protein